MAERWCNCVLSQPQLLILTSCHNPQMKAITWDTTDVSLQCSDKKDDSLGKRARVYTWPWGCRRWMHSNVSRTKGGVFGSVTCYHWVKYEQGEQVRSVRSRLFHTESLDADRRNPRDWDKCFLWWRILCGLALSPHVIIMNASCVLALV